MSRWGNSGQLTKASYGMVKQNPGLYKWTVRAAVYGILFGLIGVLPGIVLLGIGGALTENNDGSASGGAIAMFIIGTVVALIGLIVGTTAANLQMAAMVKAADDVLNNRAIDEDACRQAARGKTAVLLAWSAISVGMSIVVGAIRGDGSGGLVGNIARAVLAGLVAAVWAVVTTLVLPVIVLEQLGAVAAIKRSANLIRSTWGEALLGSVRIGARFGFLYILPGILLIVLGAVVAIAIGTVAIAGGVILILIGMALVLLGAVKSATCRNVFGVALYRWATGSGALGPFSEDDLRGAVRTK